HSELAAFPTRRSSDLRPINGCNRRRPDPFRCGLRRRKRTMIALISKKASAAAIAALACASAVALPGVASAQSYGYDYPPAYGYRSEEHTSELQSRENL